MAIPGLRPSYEMKAKVRIGVKRKTAKGTEYPASVDYFVCDEAEFARVVGEGVKELSVFLPFQHGDENFSTGLEWWQGSLLACYAKGDEQDGRPVALRKASMKQKGQEINLLEGAEVLSDEVVGNDRRKIVCPVRDCPILKRGDCKPMGRLQFFIDGIGKDGGVYQLDTKSWNSIENIERTLLGYSDLRGVPFVLRVAYTQQGDKKFPELYLEANVEVNNAQDVSLADALIQLDQAVSGVDRGEEWPVRNRLADVLDLTNPGWRDDEVVVGWVKDRGPTEAGKSLLRRHLT